MLNQGKCESLRTVNESAFVLQELALYLDTHPSCSAGLARYQQAQQDYHQAVANYESQYGPLTFDQAESCSCWQWVAAPWPWEMED